MFHAAIWRIHGYCTVSLATAFPKWNAEHRWNASWVYEIDDVAKQDVDVAVRARMLSLICVSKAQYENKAASVRARAFPR